VAEALKITDSPQKERISTFWKSAPAAGAISIALASELPAAKVVATDLSPKALAIAEENALRNGVRERIQLLPGDLFDPVEKGDAFDLIVTTRPTSRGDNFPSLMPEVRDYEPKVALDGGKDGLDFSGGFLAPQWTNICAPGAGFLAENGAGQDPPDFKDRRKKTRSWNRFAFVKDLGGITRVFKAREKKLRKIFIGRQMNADKNG